MMKARTLARLGVVKLRLEKVRRAELATALVERDRARDERDSSSEVANGFHNPLVTVGVRSVREQETLALLLERARADLAAAERALGVQEAACDTRRIASFEAARDARSLEKATNRATEREYRDARAREEKVADDRAAQRWRPS